MSRTPLTTRRVLVFDNSPTSGATRVLAGVKIPSSVEAQRSYYSTASSAGNTVSNVGSVVGMAKDIGDTIVSGINVARSVPSSLLETALVPRLNAIASVRPPTNAYTRLLAGVPNTATAMSANSVADTAMRMVSSRVGSLPTAIVSGLRAAKGPALVGLGAAAVAGVVYAGYRLWKWISSKKESAKEEVKDGVKVEEKEKEKEKVEEKPLTYQDIHALAVEIANEWARTHGGVVPEGKIVQLVQGLSAILSSSGPGDFVRKAIDYIDEQLSN